MTLADDPRQHRPSTAEPGASASTLSGPAGVWTLDGEALVASDADGPATVLVPTEAVRLLAVDLPLAGRAKRLAALPFAIEDRIAEPIESVHLALGVELSPKRYLVGVVRHDRMADWIARIEDAGLDHAALVPDALALPRPGEGEWAVDLGPIRLVARDGDGTGFAAPAALLRTAWDAAGRPPVIAYGASLPDDMVSGREALAIDPLGRRLLVPALDLRQGMYARRRRPGSSYGKRLAKILAIGALAHAGIAAADTLMLRHIADTRASETKALVASVAPGAAIDPDDIAGSVAELLPKGTTGGDDRFLPAATRVSAALAPLAGAVQVRSMRYTDGALTMIVEGGDPALAARIGTALHDAGIAATVRPDGGTLRVVATAP